MKNYYFAREAAVHAIFRTAGSPSFHYLCLGSGTDEVLVVVNFQPGHESHEEAFSSHPDVVPLMHLLSTKQLKDHVHPRTKKPLGGELLGKLKGIHPGIQQTHTMLEIAELLSERHAAMKPTIL